MRSVRERERDRRERERERESGGNFGFLRSLFELRVFVLFVDFDFPLATFGFPRLEERFMHCYLSLAQCLTAACAIALTQSAWDVCA